MVSKLSESPWQEVSWCILTDSPALPPTGAVRTAASPSPCPQFVYHLQDVVHLSQCCPSVTISTPSTISSVFSTPLAASCPPPPPLPPHHDCLHGYHFNHLSTNTATATSYFHQSSVTSSTILLCWPQASLPACVVTAVCIAASTSVWTASSSATIWCIFVSSCAPRSTSPMMPTPPLTLPPLYSSARPPPPPSLSGSFLFRNSPPHVETAGRAVSQSFLLLPCFLLSFPCCQHFGPLRTPASHG